MVNKKGTITYEFLKSQLDSNVNLVFVHGTGCNRNFLRSTAEELKQYNRYLIDLPGHGDSEDTGYSLENYINSICDFISDMENVILMGHSLGGCIVIGIAIRNPKSVKGVVISNSGASFPKIDSVLLESIKYNSIDMERFGQLLGDVDNPDVQKAGLYLESLDVILKDANIALSINFENDLNKINVPVCILGGEKDEFTYPEYSDNLNDKIKNSKLYILNDAKHSLPIARKKEATKLITDFVDSL